MLKQSAGIMVYRLSNGMVEVLLVHPGGPFWAKKDKGAWSVPKGEAENGEDLLRAARREFEEEIGQPAPEGYYMELGSFNRGGGKIVTAWAVEGTIDAVIVRSNTISIEWPPKSGKQIEIPEVDRAEWVPLSNAPEKMHKGQDVFIQRLAEKLGTELEDTPSQQSLFG